MRNKDGWFWFTVPHEVYSPYNPANDYTYCGAVLDWCRMTFGTNAMDGWRYLGQGDFLIRDEPNAVLFMLRWM